MTREKKRLLYCCGGIALSLIVYAAVVIRNFKGPIGDHVESFLYEYLSYYVSKNLTFTPLPHLNLENDQVFYPFGTNQALQSFCVERDLTFSALNALFGRGPWLQLYYLGGLIIASYGTFALLRKEHGDVKAAIAAVFANLLNFYGGQKYPYHFNMACVHWATLGIVTDFVIVERLVLKKRIGPMLILLRLLLLVLGFGLELGHVVGYGLTSLLATIVFTTLLLAYRRIRRRDKDEESDIGRLVLAAKEEWQTHRRTILALAGASFFFAVLYGSLVGQIVLATRKYNFGNVTLGVWWSHPVRLLIPYFPWVHPSMQPRFTRIYEDQAEEGIGSGGAGWFLLLIAVIGLIQGKKRLRFVPLLVICVAFIVSKPTHDYVRWMPWFAFVRVFSRATVMYSTFFSLFALGISLPSLRSRIGMGLTAVVGSIGLLELYTFAQIKLAQPAFAFDDSFIGHMEKIEKLPGEAVLDFPFCILGGNGDLHYLCPYMEKLKSVYALQRFHHKKVIGQYLGRVHPDQTRPFLRQGWPMMWDPDDFDPIRADHQIRCLSYAEWEFFTTFYYSNNFAGIQLAKDRLPPGCAEEFYSRFGQPMGEVSIPKAGHLAFIPRDPATFNRLDPEKGKSVKLDRPDLSIDIDLVIQRGGRQIEYDGLSGYEFLGDRKHPTAQWRWGLLPATTMGFYMHERMRLAVIAKLENRLVKQRVSIVLDGVEVGAWEDIPSEGISERSSDFIVESGTHILELRYAIGNTPPNVFAPSDPREMTVMFESLLLHPTPLE